MGGTFDNIHNGHKILITGAMNILKEDGYLYIGLTSEIMLTNKKYKEYLQKFELRKN